VTRIVLTAAAGAALLLVSSSWAERTAVHPTLKGTCTATDKLDANGVIVSSTLACKTSGTCSCAGTTRLVLSSTWKSPGNGGPGPERGTLTATAKKTTVTLKLTGSRDGSGDSHGKWVLVKAAGAKKSSFRRTGTYTAKTRTIGSDLGPRTTVRISAHIGCWNC
jgi:hypothetical protein